MVETVSYREAGLKTYGNKCEICGHSAVEVHHIYYQEHQDLEDKLRKAWKSGDLVAYDLLVLDAKNQGWEYFDKKALQLDKGNKSKMLSVLCGNCHTLIHKMDVGLKLLKALSPRK